MIDRSELLIVRDNIKTLYSKVENFANLYNNMVDHYNAIYDLFPTINQTVTDMASYMNDLIQHVERASFFERPEVIDQSSSSDEIIDATSNEEDKPELITDSQSIEDAKTLIENS